MKTLLVVLICSWKLLYSDCSRNNVPISVDKSWWAQSWRVSNLSAPTLWCWVGNKLAGISLQSPLEAVNAFTKSLWGWECLNISSFKGKDKQPSKHGGRWRINICNLGEQPLTVLPPLWGCKSLLQGPAITDRSYQASTRTSKGPIKIW